MRVCRTVDCVIAPRELLNEPAVSDPPRRVPLDWLLVGGFIALAVIEGVFNTDLYWRWPHVLLIVAMTFTLLWRRTHPWEMLATSLGVTSVMTLVGFLAQGEVADGPYTGAFLLINVYAMFRWGSGRRCMYAYGAMAATFALHMVIDYGGVVEAIGGFIVFLFPAELGLIARMTTQRQEQAREEVRSSERERIARELHDSVAHHVSAIAIQAQAGRAVAKNNPDAAAEALATIEEAAARTLSDMRSMVGALRGDDGAELAPQQGIRDIASLAGAHSGLRVTVAPLPEADGATAVGAALYRIAQESVTNAIRHAPGASQVEVRVANGGDEYTLTVKDDGRAVAPDGRSAGYGLIGMAERARLLGGILDAGPAPGGGWQVKAVLPVNGAST